MAIIKTIKGSAIDYSKYNIFPDQFESEKSKRGDDWIKTSMDYFFNVAQAQYLKAKNTYLRNYNLVKGIIDGHDFYIRGESAELDSFVDDLTRDVDLPNYVKHYSILSAPLNELVGELSNRPDATRVKAFDEESKNEELQFKTAITQQYILQEAKNMILAKAGMTGQELNQDQLQQLTMEQVQSYLTDYTSLAEKWANHVLEAAKMNFNMKELSEECFRDMLISGRQYYHIYEDNSKIGFGVECLNPKNVWVLTSPDRKYVKDAYAAGTIHVMELSEILDRFPGLTKEEIEHLKLTSKQANAILSPRESNYGKNISGWESIKYDTYNPLIERERAMVESQLRDNSDDISDWFGLSSNIGTFGYKYVVTQAYWKSKKKIGKVTFLDEKGQEQTALVDENYKPGPNQVGPVIWSWINQWYKGYKIGSDIYNVEEYHCLDYCPIMGVMFEIKNVQSAKSFIDLIKPYQIIFNVCMNQLWNLMEKEKGMVQVMSLRHVPTPKDGDGQDAIQIWEEEIKSRGTVFVDDSPENTKGASGFNQYTSLDLTRTKEIQTRYELAVQIKNLAWELVGTSKERLGSSAASSTATAVNQSVSASYAQTEPYFAQHEYVLNNVYQGIIDMAQYIETQGPGSTLSYVNTQGEDAFIHVNSEDIKMRDLQVFVTSRKKDQQIFQQLQALAQPMLQNGATPYEISVMYTTESLRELRRIMKDQKDKAEAAMQQQQEMAQKEQEIQQQQFEYEQQASQQEAAAQREFEHGENELNRLNKIETTMITALALDKQDPREYEDNSAIQGVELQRVKQQQDTETKIRQIESQEAAELSHLRLEYEKLQTEKQKMKNDLQIARENNKAKIKIAKSKPKTPAKKK